MKKVLQCNGITNGCWWCMVKYTNSQLHQYALNLYDWQRKWRCNMGNCRIFTMCIALIHAFIHCFVEENSSSSIDSIKECDGDGHCYYKTQGNLRKQLLRTFRIGHVSHYLAYNYGSFNENTCISKCSSYVPFEHKRKQ